MSTSTSTADKENDDAGENSACKENMFHYSTSAVAKTSENNSVKKQLSTNTNCNETKKQISERQLVEKNDTKFKKTDDELEYKNQQVKIDKHKKSDNVATQDASKRKKSIDKTKSDKNANISPLDLKKNKEFSSVPKPNAEINNISVSKNEKLNLPAASKHNTKIKSNCGSKPEDEKSKKYCKSKKTETVVEIKCKTKHVDSEGHKNNTERKGCKTKLNFSKHETKESSTKKSDNQQVHTQETITKLYTKSECLKPVLESVSNNKSDEVGDPLEESVSLNIPNTNNNSMKNIKTVQMNQNMKNTFMNSCVNSENSASQEFEQTSESSFTKEKETDVQQHFPDINVKNTPLKDPIKSKEILDNSASTINALLQNEILRMQTKEILENTKIDCAKTKKLQLSKQTENFDMDRRKSLKTQQSDSDLTNSCRKQEKMLKSKDYSTKKRVSRKRRKTIYDEPEENGQDDPNITSSFRVLRSATKHAQTTSKSKEEEKGKQRPESECNSLLESYSTMNLSASGEIPVLHLSENEESVGVSTNILEEDLHLSFDHSNEEITSPDIDKNKTLSAASVSSSTNISDSNCSQSSVRKRRRVIFTMID